MTMTWLGEGCRVYCEAIEIVSCWPADGCCPNGCSPANDSDCQTETFARTYSELPSAVHEDSQGNYVLVSGDYLFSTNHSGDILWSVRIEPGLSYFSKLLPLADNGFLFGGITRAMGAGKEDLFLVRTDAARNIIWQKTIGGTYKDSMRAMLAVPEGGFLVSAYTASFGAGSLDSWLIRLDEEGGVLWQKTFGSSGQEEGFDIQNTEDGGFVAVGRVTIDDSYEPWILKLTSDGDVEWQKTIQGVFISTFTKTSDGHFVIVGQTDLAPWIAKIDSTGQLLWQREFGQLESYISKIIETENGLITAGRTRRLGAGLEDAWLVEFDQQGAPLQQITFGGVDNDDFRDIIQTSDGGIVVVGYTFSWTSGVFGLIIKMDEQLGFTRICPAGMGLQTEEVYFASTALVATPTVFEPQISNGIISDAFVTFEQDNMTSDPICQICENDVCTPECGNNEIEVGETCDPPSECVQLCNDDDPCTQDLLIGSQDTCDAICVYQPVCSCEPGGSCLFDGQQCICLSGWRAKLPVGTVDLEYIVRQEDCVTKYYSSEYEFTTDYLSMEKTIILFGENPGTLHTEWGGWNGFAHTSFVDENGRWTGEDRLDSKVMLYIGYVISADEMSVMFYQDSRNDQGVGFTIDCNDMR
jgi:hypothetical protein